MSYIVVFMPFISSIFKLIVSRDDPDGLHRPRYPRRAANRQFGRLTDQGDNSNMAFVVAADAVHSRPLGHASYSNDMLLCVLSLRQPAANGSRGLTNLPMPTLS